METAATAKPVSGASAHDLRHQAAHVGALCQAVAVATMVTRNLVTHTQLRADAYSYCFLPGAEVHKTRYHPAKEKTANLLLERTNEQHVSQQQYCFVIRWQYNSVHSGFIGIGFFQAAMPHAPLLAFSYLLLPWHTDQAAVSSANGDAFHRNAYRLHPARKALVAC